MTYSIPLIDKNDGFETVRDTIASILATEVPAQMALATAAGKDPLDYKLRVFSERANPWELFSTADRTPIVNVWYDSSDYDLHASNVSTRQKARSRYNVDVYAQAVTTETPTGQAPGDEAAAKEAHRGAKLLRNILMHDKYKYLGLQGTVWRRWMASVTAFQPSLGTQPVLNVVACRLVLEVEHHETIDMEDHDTIEIISIEIRHEEDGEIIAEMQFGAEEEGD